MTSIESNPMNGLQKKIAAAIFLAHDEGLDMISDERLNTCEIYLDRRKMITLNERERIIRIEEPYMFLPESLRNLVDNLKDTGYRTK